VPGDEFQRRGAALDRHARGARPEDKFLIAEPLLAFVDRGQDVVGGADEIVLGGQDRRVGQFLPVRVVVTTAGRR
jgi:hypothetical protein